MPINLDRRISPTVNPSPDEIDSNECIIWIPHINRWFLWVVRAILNESNQYQYELAVPSHYIENTSVQSVINQLVENTRDISSDQLIEIFVIPTYSWSERVKVSVYQNLAELYNERLPHGPRLQLKTLHCRDSSTSFNVYKRIRTTFSEYFFSPSTVDALYYCNRYGIGPIESGSNTLHSINCKITQKVSDIIHTVFVNNYQVQFDLSSFALMMSNTLRILSGSRQGPNCGFYHLNGSYLQSNPSTIISNPSNNQPRTNNSSEILIQFSANFPLTITSQIQTISIPVGNNSDSNNLQSTSSSRLSGQEILTVQPVETIEEIRNVENCVDGGASSANMRLSGQRNRERTYMPISNRNFGVELEIINITASRACQVINEAGIECLVESYGHSVPRQWKIVTDGSVYNRQNVPGIEVVSPILNGEAGLEQVRKVCRALSAAGANVNRTCGFHVHVEARGATVHTFRTLLERYGRYEDTIDSFMPVSRRANNNANYIESVRTRLQTSNLASAYDLNSLRYAYCSSSGRDRRYAKVNLECFFRQGTVEFRQHSGTLNADKAVNWIRFVVAFYERSHEVAISATANSARATRVTARGRQSRSASARYFADVSAARPYRPAFTGRYGTRVRLNELYDQLVTGASIAWIASRFGIAHDSVPAYISRLRRDFRLNIIKDRATDTYRLAMPETAVAAAATSVTNVSDTWQSGQDPEVVSFLMERASDFGFEVA